MLNNEHAVRAVRTERLGVLADATRPEEHGVDLTTLGVSNHSCGGDSLESSAAKLTTTRLGECKNICH